MTAECSDDDWDALPDSVSEQAAVNTECLDVADVDQPEVTFASLMYPLSWWQNQELDDARMDTFDVAVERFQQTKKI